MSDTQKFQHVLFQREIRDGRKIRPIENWHEWLVRWNAVVGIEEMLGLLHCGFDVSLNRIQHGQRETEPRQRLAFYFSVADAWKEPYLLRLPNETDRDRYSQGYAFGRDGDGRKIFRQPSELRQIVARKAFEMLCHNFFKRASDIPKSYSLEDWPGVWRSPEVLILVLPLIQNFFRVEEEYGRLRVRNLPHWETKVPWEAYPKAFLMALAAFVFDVWSPRNTEYYRKLGDRERIKDEDCRMAVRVKALKPWIAEVLYAMDELSFFESEKHRHRMLRLDRSSLRRLRQIAMATEFEGKYGKNRKVKTLEEACFSGSSAAWFLRSRSLIVRETQRLKRIQLAEAREEEAKRRLERLKRA